MNWTIRFQVSDAAVSYVSQAFERTMNRPLTTLTSPILPVPSAPSVDPADNFVDSAPATTTESSSTITTARLRGERRSAPSMSTFVNTATITAPPSPPRPPPIRRQSTRTRTQSTRLNNTVSTDSLVGRCEAESSSSSSGIFCHLLFHPANSEEPLPRQRRTRATRNRARGRPRTRSRNVTSGCTVFPHCSSCLQNDQDKFVERQDSPPLILHQLGHDRLHLE